MGENLSELGSALKENWLRSGRKERKKIRLLQGFDESFG